MNTPPYPTPVGYVPLGELEINDISPVLNLSLTKFLYPKRRSLTTTDSLARIYSHILFAYPHFKRREDRFLSFYIIYNIFLSLGVG